MRRTFINFIDDISMWGRGWGFYLEKKLRRFGFRFETQKSMVVDVLMARRGTYQRPFLHVSLLVLVIAGFVGAPMLANAYPGGLPGSLDTFTPPSAVVTSLDLTEYGIATQISEKPRDQVITHTVKEGETFSSIAKTYNVSIDTIKWANDLKRDSLSIGQELKIPPVSGIVHKVREGETVYSVAKRYKTDAQKIVNFPFNDFSDLDTFALNVGQTLIVPDGVPPAAPSIIVPLPPVFAGGTGQFLWPAGGMITQYPVWYHNALDIANPSAPGIASADRGMVTVVEYLRYGYGFHVIVDHGGGLSTLYAHLSEIYVKPGDEVARGQIIGRMGSTGRSTGTHLHFEVRRGGITVDPRSFLK
ncbi:MAG: Peptidase M23 family protein [Candidatus Gottesmanbacteria bacterium GW2011_GWA1_48_13]|uniref:Peptidase M23 family protein n=1 Tax=Candidatus Gottesmanbacteria bacterium GW2011_GWA1_48_13 TaxID=1618439 RepID=A0A0G1UNM6_9BACT|nr:MAG: Peptidase M23 family protein [Candidatus Gottesmanbacteria bacterium GW2011_GWA1_48_13]